MQEVKPGGRARDAAGTDWRLNPTSAPPHQMTVQRWRSPALPEAPGSFPAKEQGPETPWWTEAGDATSSGKIRGSAIELSLQLPP